MKQKLKSIYKELEEVLHPIDPRGIFILIVWTVVLLCLVATKTI
jgi:hypothetical protein